jgi:predicted aldo/keto reductase-like oxidoreductase
MLIATYNEIRVAPVTNSIMRIEGLPEDKKPSACIGCGKCTKVCPENINVPQVLKDFDKAM